MPSAGLGPSFIVLWPGLDFLILAHLIYGAGFRFSCKEPEALPDPNIVMVLAKKQ